MRITRITFATLTLLGILLLGRSYSFGQAIPSALLHERIKPVEDTNERYFDDGELMAESLKNARTNLRQAKLDAETAKRLDYWFGINRQRVSIGDRRKEVQSLTNAFERAGGKSNREFMLIDSLSFYFEKSDWQSYCAAHSVHSSGLRSKPDSLDIEANLLKALAFMRAGILAPAFACAHQANDAADDIPLAKGLLTSLQKRGQYKAAPTKVSNWPTREFDCQIEIWESDSQADQPWTLVLRDKKGLFIGAMVLQARKGPDRDATYVLEFRDFDAPPVLIADFGVERPDSTALGKVVYQFTPAIGLSRPVYDVSEPVRLNDEFNDLRCDIESLHWQGEGVWPLASWWVNQAPQSAALVRKHEVHLKKGNLWRWEFKGRIDVNGDPSSRDFPGFSILGFDNDIQITAFTDLSQPMEHAHFIVTLAGSNQYMLSYVITSQKLSTGERYYLLSRRVSGESEVVKILGSDPPDFLDAQKEVQTILHQHAAKALDVEYQNESPTITLAKQRQKEASRETKQPIKVKNSIGMSLSLIPSGRYLMGSPDTEISRRETETQHLVRLTNPFYLGAYEVTQAEFKRVTSRNPSLLSPEGEFRNFLENGVDTSNLPVENVTWDDAREFCELLSNLPEEKKAGRRYRLPTEAEWEYACRALTTTRFPSGYSIRSVKSIANVEDASHKGWLGGTNPPFDKYWWDDSYGYTAPVGQFQPNAWGVCDMQGNVSEWCRDQNESVYFTYKNYYAWAPTNNPAGPCDGDGHVVRGSNYNSGYRYWVGFRSVRSADRIPAGGSSIGSTIGFRVVCDIPEAKPPRLVNEGVGSAGGVEYGAKLNISIPESMIRGHYWVYVNGELLRSKFSGVRDEIEVRLHRTDSGLYAYSKDAILLYKINSNSGFYINREFVKSQHFSVVLPDYVLSRRTTHEVELVTTSRGAIPLTASKVTVECKPGFEANVELPLPKAIFSTKPVRLFAIRERVAVHLFEELLSAQKDLARDKLFQFLVSNYRESQLPGFNQWRLNAPITNSRLIAELGEKRFVDEAQLRLLIDGLKEEIFGSLISEAEQNKGSIGVKEVLAEIKSNSARLDQFYAITDAMKKIKRGR